MKRICVLLLMAVLVLGIMAGCSSEPPVPIDEALVGTWVQDGSATDRLVLEADGTGMAENALAWHVGEEPGEWFIRFGDAEDYTHFTYELIDGQILKSTLAATGQTFVYIKAEYAEGQLPSGNSPVVGVWALETDNQNWFIFGADGTGTIGADEISWWTIGDDIVAMNFGEHINLFFYEIDGEHITFSRVRDGETFPQRVWLAEDVDSVLLPTNMLYDEALLERLVRYAVNLEFADIIEMVDQYLRSVDATEEDIAYEVRELAVRAEELLAQVYVYVDDFDGQVTVYYPGVREISSSINIVPYIRPGSTSQI